MPARSKKQRRLMAIAEHHPEKLYKKNRGVLSMGASELHKFAATPEKRLPTLVKVPRKRKKKG
jgi:hypothetical protein